MLRRPCQTVLCATRLSVLLYASFVLLLGNTKCLAPEVTLHPPDGVRAENNGIF